MGPAGPVKLERVPVMANAAAPLFLQVGATMTVSLRSSTSLPASSTTRLRACPLISSSVSVAALLAVSGSIRR